MRIAKASATQAAQHRRRSMILPEGMTLGATIRRRNAFQHRCDLPPAPANHAIRAAPSDHAVQEYVRGKGRAKLPGKFLAMPRALRPRGEPIGQQAIGDFHLHLAL